MAIKNSDGSIILTTEVDESGLKKGTRDARSEAAKLAAEYRKAGLSQSEAMKKAWSEIERNTKETKKTTKATKQFGDQAKTTGKQVTKSMGGIPNTLKGIATKLLAIVGIYELINFGKKSVELASDLQEVQNVVDVAFGSMAYKIEEFSKTAIENFGISELTAKRTASTYMAMAKGMGIADDVASDMAITMTGLTADIASFYNMSQERADVILKSVYTGETETLKQLGIVMTEVNLQNFAMSKGITKSLSAMTQQEKTMLRYQFVLEQTRLASGDFARTQDSWANQTRILSERWKEMSTLFGEAFMTVGSLVLPVINSMISGLTKVAEASKLVAQWIYKAFTGKELKTSQSAVVEQLGESALNASDGMEALGDATEEAGKKATKSLFAFDEIQKADKSSSGETGNVSTGEIGQSITSDNTKNQEQITFLDDFSSKLKFISDLFMSGFWQGFQNADFSSIKNSISGIGTSLKNIFTNPQVISSAQNFASSVVLAFGQITGSIASIGTTIATNLLGGFNQYLQTNSPFIQTSISKIFDASSGVATSVGNMWTAFANIFSVFASTNGQTLTANIIGIFANAGLGISTLGHQIGQDFINFLTQPIIDNQDGLKGILAGLLGTFATLTGGIKLLVDTLVENVLNLYDEHISPFIQVLTESVSEFVNHFIEGYNIHIKPVLDAFAQKFVEVVQQYIVPMVNKIMTFVGKIIDIISVLWKTILQPIVSWIIDVFVNAFSEAFGLVGNVINNAIKFISGLISGIMDILNGIIDFIVGVFSGDWKKAWNGLVGIFKGIINTIISVFEGMINYVIFALNTFISGLDIVVGAVGSVFGQDWNVPKIPSVSIPRLAQGAVIPPNREFLAVLGDQKHGTNIEAPADLIKQMVNEALIENGGATPQVNIVAKGDLDSIISLFKFEIERQDRLAGATI